MLQNNLPTDLSPEDNLFQQAKEAIRAEKYAQARELLTKLIQTNQQNALYWVWMSAAMETQKERLYCLQTAYKLDPSNEAARRGLVLMGALTLEAPLQPFPMNHPRPEGSKIKPAEAKEKPKKTSNPTVQLAAAIGLVSLVLIGTFIGLRSMARRPAPAAAPKATSRPTVTPYATASSTFTPGASTPRPLSDLLSATYTPTALYAATPHSGAAGDGYNAAMHAYKSSQWDILSLMMAQVATAEPGSADALYFMGEASRLSGNYPKAISEYKAAIAVNPRYAPSYLGRALANLALNPQDNILDDLNLAIKTDPKYAEAYLERGLYFFNKKDFKPAEADLKQAILLNDSALAETSLAQVLLAQQENLAALQAAIRANQMDITSLDAYLVLGMAYQANGQIDQAVTAMETYIKYRSDNAGAFALLGSAYYDRGEYAAAETVLLQSLNINNSDPGATYWLGKTYLGLKQYQKAFEYAQKARDLAPDSFEVSEGLAEVYMALGQFNNSYSAIVKVEKFATNANLRARFLYIRALSLDELDQSGIAFRDWSEILTLAVDAVPAEIRTAAKQQVNEFLTPSPTLSPSTKSQPSLTVTRPVKPTSHPSQATDMVVVTATPKSSNLISATAIH